MKNILNKCMLVLLATTMLIACKKDENKVYFEGGTAPVLTASNTNAMVLTKPNENNTAISFNWTNPNYRFNTGISSQDVTYTLQVDSTGRNFTGKDLQEVAFPKALSTTLTVKELNTILAKLNVAENIPHRIDFRVKSTLVNNSVPLFSNVITIVITPYLDVAVPIPPSGELYITGSAVASSWTNTPPAAQKFTKLSNTEYTLTISLTANEIYKFLSTQGQWQPQYGGTNATGGDLGFNMGGGNDPAAIPSPAVGGMYKITVNFKTGKYAVVKI
jgi:starch-binding outer membrane protein SusE/F